LACYFTEDFGTALKLISIGTSAAYVYIAGVSLDHGYFPFTSVYFETAQ
jgi:hypothetical protein